MQTLDKKFEEQRNNHDAFKIIKNFYWTTFICKELNVYSSLLSTEENQTRSRQGQAQEFEFCLQTSFMELG